MLELVMQRLQQNYQLIVPKAANASGLILLFLLLLKVLNLNSIFLKKKKKNTNI